MNTISALELPSSSTRIGNSAEGFYFLFDRYEILIVRNRHADELKKMGSEKKKKLGSRAKMLFHNPAVVALEDANHRLHFFVSFQGHVQYLLIVNEFLGFFFVK